MMFVLPLILGGRGGTPLFLSGAGAARGRPVIVIATIITSNNIFVLSSL